MLIKLKDKLKHHFHEVMRTKTSKHSIALGFAIGTFIAILPTPGFSLILALLVILIFEKVNKFAVLIALVVWNPVTLTPIYLLSYKLGDLLFGPLPTVKFEIEILNQVYHFSRRFLVGNLLIAIVMSVLSYFAVRIGVRIYRRHKKEHM